MPGHPDGSDHRASAFRDDLPAVGSLPDLRRRLERLPPGHPSSPYNGDGARRPPTFRLKDLELPLPDDDRRGNGSGSPERTARVVTGLNDTAADSKAAVRREAADHREEAASHAAADLADGAASHEAAADRAPAGEPAGGADDASRDGSWEARGRQLTPEQARIADEALEVCRAAEGRDVFGGYGEGGLTPAMRRIEAQLDQGRLAPDTEKFALKSADRFKEKLADRITLQPDTPPAGLTAGIHDGIRYSFIFESDYYTVGIWQVSDILRKNGHELTLRKPMWRGPAYKGVNSQWRDPDSGAKFELQFHTPESWDAKQRTHDAYEKLADPATPPDERRRIDAFQREIATSVPVPPGALQMTPYRKNGA